MSRRTGVLSDKNIIETCDHQEIDYNKIIPIVIEPPKGGSLLIYKQLEHNLITKAVNMSNEYISAEEALKLLKNQNIEIEKLIKLEEPVPIAEGRLIASEYNTTIAEGVPVVEGTVIEKEIDPDEIIIEKNP